MLPSSRVTSHPRVSAWLEIREPLEQQLEPLGLAAIAALRLSPGERVLDVGCGIGGTPAALARLVGLGGQVIGLELLEPAVTVARLDAALPASVSFVCGDGQTHPFAPGSFDAVFSRFGIMFFSDPLAAFRNLGLALRPGGRLGFVCWRGLDENELDSMPLRAAAQHLPSSLVAEMEAAPWFSFADPDYLQKLLEAAGFRDFQIDAHDERVGCGSLEATVEVCTRGGALGSILRNHPQFRVRCVDALRSALAAERHGPQGPQLLAATWVVSARTG